MRTPANRTSIVGRPRRDFGRLSKGSLIGLLLVLTFALSACADEEPAEFTEGTKSGFMAACSDLVEDSRFVGEICECVFDRTQDEFSFSRFSAIDQGLVENPESPLSNQVVSIVADCVISTTEL